MVSNLYSRGCRTALYVQQVAGNKRRPPLGWPNAYYISSTQNQSQIIIPDVKAYRFKNKNENDLKDLEGLTFPSYHGQFA